MPNLLTPLALLLLLSLPAGALAQAPPSTPPTEVRVATAHPNERENQVALTLTALWSDAFGANLVGSANCALSAADAQLTASALIFPALARRHCTSETSAGIIDAVLRYYAANPGFQSEMAAQLTAAGEALRIAEEIRRGCPNHPTQCLRFRAKIESYRANEAMPYSVVVMFSVDETNPSNRVTCTFLTSAAELTPVELRFGALTPDICVGDANAVAFLADVYARNIEGFKTEVDVCVTTAGRQLHRPEEIVRDCPHHPSWCPADPPDHEYWVVVECPPGIRPPELPNVPVRGTPIGNLYTYTVTSVSSELLFRALGYSRCAAVEIGSDH